MDTSIPLQRTSEGFTAYGEALFSFTDLQLPTPFSSVFSYILFLKHLNQHLVHVTPSLLLCLPSCFLRLKQQDRSAFTYCLHRHLRLILVSSSICVLCSLHCIIIQHRIALFGIHANCDRIAG